MSLDTPISSDLDLSHCTNETKVKLEAFLALFQTRRPTLRQLWAALDFVWDMQGIDNCAPSDMELAAFYSHPVWVLNGIFAEQHTESLENRHAFAKEITSLRPNRVADFGGGFGTLGRIVGKNLPDATVEIIEPFPSEEALGLINGYPNVNISDKLSGKYDIIISVDVFEHISDPIELLFKMAQHLDDGGSILVANHFSPSIKCHLPCTFHLSDSWHVFMRLAGFTFSSKIRYGEIYRKYDTRDLDRKVRTVERLSRKTYAWSKKKPYQRILRRWLLCCIELFAR